MRTRALRKDESLDRLAEQINVAHFVAFAPVKQRPHQTFSRIRGDTPNQLYKTPRLAIERLLAQSPEGRVNIRSYKPGDPQSKPFNYGLSNIDEVERIIGCRIADGLHVIVNESVDISDGGVSGVVEGGIVEFSPDDTPRCVERPGTASLPLSWALRLLATIYGVPPDIELGDGWRLEFSIHPHPCGWRATHTLAWELDSSTVGTLSPALSWPNRFSRFIGDKAYGLMMADLAGLPVPVSTVFHRRIAPFSFGRETGSTEVWVRTCPALQHAGLFATKHGWIDPFRLLSNEDPDPRRIIDPDTSEVRTDFTIPSVIVQSGVTARFSGAFNVNCKGETIIEGIAGAGDAFMLGEKGPEPIPDEIASSVMSSYKTLSEIFGHVRFEWVFDGNEIWVVQMHCGAVEGSGEVIVPGEASDWHRFVVSNGLDALRETLASLEFGDGLIIVGEFGLTSHIADVIRKSGFPTRIGQ